MIDNTLKKLSGSWVDANFTLPVEDEEELVMVEMPLRVFMVAKDSNLTLNYLGISPGPTTLAEYEFFFQIGGALSKAGLSDGG